MFNIFFIKGYSLNCIGKLENMSIFDLFSDNDEYVGKIHPQVMMINSVKLRLNIINPLVRKKNKDLSPYIVSKTYYFMLSTYSVL